jgi:L-ascorbate metabolism protein UlaG (beta-lactamase superfamily)
MTFIIIVIVLILAVYLFVQRPAFGALSNGARLEKIRKSPQFVDGKFQNLSFTPEIKEGVSYYRVMKEFFFDKDPGNIPPAKIPSLKTNLHKLDKNENVLIWFGHSSYFMQIDGKKFLIDPVLSGSASPVSFTTRSFKGTDVYTVDDIPPIDYLLISHDHWDHLDYKTIIGLKSKIGKVITGLGTAAHFARWGFSRERIIEEDWFNEILLADGFKIITMPARHFSGRGLKRNQALWTSFALQAPSLKIYIGGDSGYDSHFKTIGDQFGPFDLAILECGQYHEYWKYIHMLPHQVPQAAKDLQAKVLLPVHWSKFSLALHSWDEPIRLVTKAAAEQQVPVITPLIGEKVELNQPAVFTNPWWENVH